MKQLLLTLGLFILGNLMAQCQERKTALAEANAKGWKTDTDSAKLYSITYPAHWAFREKPERIGFFVTSPLQNEEDNFKDNVNLIVRESTFDQLDINAVSLELVKKLSENVNDFSKISERKNLKTNGVGYYEIEYVGNYPSGEQNVAIYIIQRIFVKNYHIYTLTFTSKSNEQIYYRSLAFKIFDNLKVL